MFGKEFSVMYNIMYKDPNLGIFKFSVLQCNI